MKNIRTGAALEIYHRRRVVTLTEITLIHAPVGRCFNLSRSIDLHKASTARTGEQAIAGVTAGLIAER
jgi:hypothetical protein